jgi:hypothetical protein
MDNLTGQRPIKSQHEYIEGHKITNKQNTK